MNTVIKEEYKYSELTARIIKSAMSVHNFLGNGFQETIYHRAFAYELTQESLDFIQELKMNIFCKDLVNPIGSRRVDFFS